MERWPDYLIIGTMKAGTSSLYKHLTDHPEVDAATTKEVRFFSKYFDRGPDWYRAQFPMGSGRISGEATPSYMYDRDAIDRMAATVPEAKLIAILRHPVDRAWSHYRMRRALGGDRHSFGEILANGRAPSAPTREQFESYVGRGEYVDQLEHVTNRFPREQLLVHLFDELERDPASVYDETCRFLGISTSFRPQYLDKAVNAHAEFRSLALRRMTKRRGPAWFRKAVGRINVKHPPPEPIDPDLRAQLVEHFRPYNRRLEAWLGRDLSHWDR